MNLLENVAVQWLIRRLPELGGLIMFITTIVSAIPPEHMATLVAILKGQGGGLTVTALIGLGLWVYAQVISYLQTTKPKVVEKVQGTTVELTPRRKSLLDILTGK